MKETEKKYARSKTENEKSKKLSFQLASFLICVRVYIFDERQQDAVLYSVHVCFF